MGKEQSKDARVGELDWSSQKLKELPIESIEKGRYLEYEILNLNNNQLTSLDGVEVLKAVKRLNASRNNLKNYNASLLPNLDYLNLSFNQLSKIPDSINSVRTLKELVLSNNKISDICPDIQCLTNIVFLDLSYNQITVLPDAFGTLTSLETLYLNNNLLTTGGCKFGELYSLRMIDLSGNKLKDLPDVTFLASIRKLYLNSNQLKELSPNIVMLPKLKELSLRNNQLKSLPRELETLPCLNLIDLDDNLFKEPSVFSSNDVSLMMKYLHGSYSEKQRAIADAKKLANNITPLGYTAVHLSISEVGLNRHKKRDSTSISVAVSGYKKRLFWIKGTKQVMMAKKVPVKHSSMNIGDCFVLDIGKKVFVWEGGESNPYEKAKAEYLASLLAAEQGDAPVIILDAGAFEDSPLLPEGFAFWDGLGGKGNVLSSEEGGDDEIVPSDTMKSFVLYSVIENDVDKRCDIEKVANGLELHKAMLNSSHCFVLDCHSEIFVWAGMQSSGNEKSWAMLKAEELEQQEGRPDCILVSWILDRDEKLFFKEQFPDWRDSGWRELLKHTKMQKAVEVSDVGDYDRVLKKQIKEEEKRLAKGESYSEKKRKKNAASSTGLKRLSRKITGNTTYKVKEEKTKQKKEEKLESKPIPILSKEEQQIVDKKESPITITPVKQDIIKKEEKPITTIKEDKKTIIKEDTPKIEKKKSEEIIIQKPVKTERKKVKIPAAFSNESNEPVISKEIKEEEEKPIVIKKEEEKELEEKKEVKEKEKTTSRLARLKSPLTGPSRTARATKNPVKERARKEKEDESKRVSEEDSKKAARRNAAAGAYGMLWALGVDASMFEKRKQDRAKNPTVKTAKPPHLYHLKGRRRVFIREVEISYSSLNSGDVFILDNGNRELFMWNGKKANRIEKGSALDFAKKLKDKQYFGNARIITLDEGKTDGNADGFWDLLGKGKIKSAEDGGNDEDAVKIFRDCVKLFRVEITSNDPLTVELVLVNDGPYPKELLDTNECFILDCMSEIYPWTGKKSNTKVRQQTLKKAESMATERPFWVAEVERQLDGAECVLFKEKFTNWSSGLPITVAQVAVGINTSKVQLSGKVDVKPLHTKAKQKEEVMIDDASGDVKIWRIEDFEKVLIPPEQYGYFYSGDSYIVLYKYIWKNKDCFIIYYFQGRDSSVNEKGTSAVLTIELDKEISGMAKEIRVVQYKEPKHFLMLFQGKMVIHSGKAQSTSSKKSTLYDIRNYSSGPRAVQCHCRPASLNPNHTFVLGGSESKFFVWFGKYSPKEEREFALQNKLLQGASITEIEQGKESSEFWKIIGGKSEYPYQSLSNGISPRLFHCSVGTGTFGISEVLDYSQDDLSTHDIFILDAEVDIFVWFGRRSAEKEQRWSMEAAVEYAETAPKKRDKNSIWRVKEGEEPYKFTTHFHSWMVKKKNEQENGIDGGLISVVDLLEQFSRKYSYEELKSGKFSKALDTANIEQYLEDGEFENVFKMTRDAFQALPGWKRTNLKKSLGLF